MDSIDNLAEPVSEVSMLDFPESTIDPVGLNFSSESNYDFPHLSQSGCIDNLGVVPSPLSHGEVFDNDFSSWIPRYSKPEVACDYCRSRQLECFKTYEGQASCSPCNALFRPCSFTQTAADATRPKNALDTLHVVSEDAAQCNGVLTGIKPLKSNVLSKMAASREEGASSRKSTVRFSKAAIRILKTWMDDHRDHPYPTESEKLELQEITGLSSSQVSNWLANTRRREKNKIPKGSTSPSIRPCRAVQIPDGKTWESMGPFERWQNSPPENEPAPLTAIVDAVENFDLPIPEQSEPVPLPQKQHDSASSGGYSRQQERSTTSWEGRSTSALSSGSFGTAWSHGSSGSLKSFGSFGSFNSFGKKDRRRRRRPVARMTHAANTAASNRPFQCTFCTDRFKSKYDWSRHEKSLHISLERWLCAPIGKQITNSASGQKMCVYCDALDPDEEHFESHNTSACEGKGLDGRTFFRKDHLRQHLRLMHNGCKLIDSMDSWKSECVFIRSRCGFCREEFTKWQDRVDHLAKEFRNGAQMKNWKGCRGLDPDVAAQVTNAMPPFLIDHESRSMMPFSATNRSSMRNEHFNGRAAGDNTPMVNIFAAGEWSPGSTMQRPSLNKDVNMTNATCWEILTVAMGHFARQKVQEGVVLTDEMLQRQARLLLYDNDDPWNQTAADNPEWLGLFKKAHGITHAPEDFSMHTALEQLGITSENGRENAMASFNAFQNLSNSGGDTVGGQCTVAGSCNTGMSSVPALSTPASLSEPPSASSEAFLLPEADLFKDVRHINCPVQGLPDLNFSQAMDTANIRHADCPVGALGELNFFADLPPAPNFHCSLPTNDFTELNFSTVGEAKEQRRESSDDTAGLFSFPSSVSTNSAQHAVCTMGDMHFGTTPALSTPGTSAEAFEPLSATLARDRIQTDAEVADEFLAFPFEMTM